MVMQTKRIRPFKKKVMDFDVYIITGCYFYICFMLIVNCNVKHKAAIVTCSPEVVLKVIHKPFENRKSQFEI